MGFFDIFKSADSFWEMGENCFYGRNGASKDHEMAREYYEKALKKGTSKPLLNLLAIYSSSAEAIKKNQKRIFELCQRDAFNEKLTKREQALAQNNLGTCYFNGIGVPIDKKEGLTWYQVAADNGSTLGSFQFAKFSYKPLSEDSTAYFTARKYMEKAFANRKGLTPKEQAEIEQKYKELFEQLSKKELEGKSGYDLYMKGIEYQEGRSGIKDAKEAERWFKQAYKTLTDNCNTNSYSMFCLAYCYYFGNGCPADKQKAKQCLLKSRAAGCENAEPILYKWFPEVKEEERINDLRKKADAEDATEEALIEMALYCLDNGEYEQAVDYCEKAIKKHSSPDALVINAIICEQGYKPYEKDIKRADNMYAWALTKNGPKHYRLQYAFAKFAFYVYFEYPDYILDEYALASPKEKGETYLTLSVGYIKKAMEQNYYKAYEFYGNMLVRSSEPAKGEEPLKTALENGINSAAIYLGLLYCQTNEKEKAVHYFELFHSSTHDKVEDDLETFCYNFLMDYFKEKGNKHKYIKYLQIQCDRGVGIAILDMLQYLINGEYGVKRDMKKAKTYATKLLDFPQYKEQAQIMLDAMKHLS